MDYREKVERFKPIAGVKQSCVLKRTVRFGNGMDSFDDRIPGQNGIMWERQNHGDWRKFD